MAKRSRPFLAPSLVTALVALAGCASPTQPSARAPAPSTDDAGFVAQLSQTRRATGTRSGEDRPRPPARRVRTAPEPAPTPTSDPFADAFVAAHNLHRARVSPAASPPLPTVRWSDELAAHAQAWADRCEFEHSRGDYGENLAARTGLADPETIVGDWVAEADAFDYARNRCAAGEVCGHYTQVVWRDSTEIGCAMAQCDGGGPFGGYPWVLWVCNYSPAGNWQGERPY